MRHKYKKIQAKGNNVSFSLGGILIQYVDKIREKYLYKTRAEAIRLIITEHRKWNK